MTNTVYLVGAGPGDPDLLTVKALRLIQNADVIIYDRLVADPILDLIPAHVKRVFAGKAANKHFMAQEDINALLVELAQTNSIVVRLKGGDPFIFGRGGEEAEHLIENNVSFEVIPGISASIGCSAYAGIPLTHRDWAQSVRFVTGHSQAGKELDLNWDSLADPQTTLVVYMGTVNAQIISEKLIDAGLPASTPVAIINNGTRPDQKVIQTSLDGMPGIIIENGIRGATLLVIGQVAGLANKIGWFKG